MTDDTKERIVITTPLTKVKRQHVRIVAANLGISSAELMRRALDDFLEKWADEPNNIIFVDE